MASIGLEDQNHKSDPIKKTVPAILNRKRKTDLLNGVSLDKVATWTSRNLNKKFFRTFVIPIGFFAQKTDLYLRYVSLSFKNCRFWFICYMNPILVKISWVINLFYHRTILKVLYYSIPTYRVGFHWPQFVPTVFADVGQEGRLTPKLKRIQGWSDQQN